MQTAQQGCTVNNTRGAVFNRLCWSYAMKEKGNDKDSTHTAGHSTVAQKSPRQHAVVVRTNEDGNSPPEAEPNVNEDNFARGGCGMARARDSNSEELPKAIESKNLQRIMAVAHKEGNIESNDLEKILAVAQKEGKPQATCQERSTKTRTRRTGTGGSLVGKPLGKREKLTVESPGLPRIRHCCKKQWPELLRDGFAEHGAVILSNQTVIATTSKQFREIKRHHCVVRYYAREYMKIISGQLEQCSAMLGEEAQAVHAMLRDQTVLEAFDRLFEDIWRLISIALKELYPNDDWDRYGRVGPVVKEKVAYINLKTANKNAQLLHADSMFQRNMTALIALSKIEEPTMHLPYK